MKIFSPPHLPVEIVLAPTWWQKHTGMSFDEDFFYHPARRVEAEQKMEQVLDDQVSDANIAAIFKTVHELREKFGSDKNTGFEP